MITTPTDKDFEIFALYLECESIEDMAKDMDMQIKPVSRIVLNVGRYLFDRFRTPEFEKRALTNYHAISKRKAVFKALLVKYYKLIKNPEIERQEMLFALTGKELQTLVGDVVREYLEIELIPVIKTSVKDAIFEFHRDIMPWDKQRINFMRKYGHLKTREKKRL
jgi:hypothetical protein